MAVKMGDSAQVGAGLALFSKAHLDPKMSVSTALELETLNDYLPDYSLVIVEDTGGLYQLQPDGSWLEKEFGSGATINDTTISDSEVMSSSKVDNTYAKKSDTYTKTEADDKYGTKTQQDSNTTAITQLTSKVEGIGNAVRITDEVQTYGDLLLLENIENGELYFVKSDETHDFQETKYVMGKNGWIFNGYNEIKMRDFTIDKIDLGSDIDGVHHTEVTGKLPLSNVDLGDGFDAANISYNDNEEYSTVAEALNALLYKDLKITFITTSPTTLEQGNSVTNPVFNWTYSKNIVSQSFDGDTIDADLRTFTYDGTITGNKLFTLRANDGKKDFSSIVEFSFLWKSYYGSAAIPASMDNDFILGLSGNKLQNNVKQTYSMSCADNQYLWFAFPQDLCGSIRWFCGGFEGGIQLVQSGIVVENIYNSTKTYNLYRSDNHSLGSCSIEVK